MLSLNVIVLSHLIFRIMYDDSETVILNRGLGGSYVLVIVVLAHIRQTSSEDRAGVCRDRQAFRSSFAWARDCGVFQGALHSASLCATPVPRSRNQRIRRLKRSASAQGDGYYIMIIGSSGNVAASYLSRQCTPRSNFGLPPSREGSGGGEVGCPQS